MANIINFPQRGIPKLVYRWKHIDSLPYLVSADVIVLHPVPRLTMLAENLWCYRMTDTPEADAQAQRIIAEFRANDYIVPAYMKEF